MHVQTFNYLSNAVRVEGNCDTEIRSRIEIVKVAFKDLNNVLTYEYLARDKENNAKLLCHMYAHMWPRSLDIFFIDEEECWNNTDLSSDAENIMDKGGEQVLRKMDTKM